MAHKLENKIVSQRFSHKREALRPKGLALKPSRPWVQEVCRAGGNGDFTLAGHTQGFMYTGTQHKAVTPQELESHYDSWWGRKGSSSGGSPREYWEAWALLMVTILALRPGPTRVHVSGQTTSRIGTQPHPSADRVPQATLSSQPPISTLLNVALSTRGTRPSSTHQWAGRSPSHQEACTRPRTNLTHQRAETRRKRSYDPPASGKETTNTETKTKWDNGEIYSRRRNKIKPHKNNWSGERQPNWKIIQNLKEEWAQRSYKGCLIKSWKI